MSSRNNRSYEDPIKEFIKTEYKGSDKLNVLLEKAIDIDKLYRSKDEFQPNKFSEESLQETKNAEQALALAFDLYTTIEDKNAIFIAISDLTKLKRKALDRAMEFVEAKAEDRVDVVPLQGESKSALNLQGFINKYYINLDKSKPLPEDVNEIFRIYNNLVRQQGTERDNQISLAT